MWTLGAVIRKEQTWALSVSKPGSFYVSNTPRCHFCHPFVRLNILVATYLKKHFIIMSPQSQTIIEAVVSHALLHKEGLNAVIKHLPAQGRQQQLGAFSWDLDSGECEELWQQQGLELADTQKGNHCEHCTTLQ